MEPTYYYKKGEGWLPQFPCIVTMSCGTVVRLEARPPRYQERYSFVYNDADDGWIEDGRPVLAKFAESIQEDVYKDLDGWHDYNADERTNRVWVTIKLLDDM